MSDPPTQDVGRCICWASGFALATMTAISAALIGLVHLSGGHGDDLVPGLAFCVPLYGLVGAPLGAQSYHRYHAGVDRALTVAIGRAVARSLFWFSMAGYGAAWLMRR
jgi:hypothetical protein